MKKIILLLVSVIGMSGVSDARGWRKHFSNPEIGLSGSWRSFERGYDNYHRKVRDLVTADVIRKIELPQKTFHWSGTNSFRGKDKHVYLNLPAYLHALTNQMIYVYN